MVGKHISIFFITLILILGTSCQRAKTGASTEVDPVLQVVEKYLDLEGENGFSGAVLVKTATSGPLVKAYGLANDELDIPNSPDVVFSIGSLAKQFTGAAILKLQMLGKLNIMDSLGKFIPGLNSDLSSITLHQLLTHTSGLPADMGTLNEVITREDFLARLQETAIPAANRDRYLYSHTGYNLLAILIERISGEDYESFLSQHLFKPAGMKHTGYRIPDWASAAVAHGYSFCNDWGRPMDSGWLDDGPSWNRRGSGAMLSTLNDLYAWHLALLGNEILDAQSKDQYYHPAPTVQINEVSTMGYGWRIIQSSRKTEVIAHNGWNGRFYADFLRYTTEGVTIILLSNRFRNGNENMPFEIAKCIFRQPYEPVLMGRKTECLDSLPSNRIGRLANDFLVLMSNGSKADFQRFIKDDIASHLINKYSNQALMDSLQSLQRKSGPVKIKQLRLFDNRILTLDVLQLNDSREASFRLFYDENDNYKIRGISYTGPEDRY